MEAASTESRVQQALAEAAAEHRPAWTVSDGSPEDAADIAAAIKALGHDTALVAAQRDETGTRIADAAPLANAVRRAMDPDRGTEPRTVVVDLSVPGGLTDDELEWAAEEAVETVQYALDEEADIPEDERIYPDAAIYFMFEVFVVIRERTD